MTRNEAIKFVEAFVRLRDLATDEMSLEVPNLYPAWKEGVTYLTNERVLYDWTLYKVLQEHTSQADWTPDITPALFTPIGLTEEGYPVWAQPTGEHDAYNTGDIVSYNDTLYISTIDGNVWSPDAYPAGWEVYAE